MGLRFTYLHIKAGEVGKLYAHAKPVYFSIFYFVHIHSTITINVCVSGNYMIYEFKKLNKMTLSRLASPMKLHEASHIRVLKFDNSITYYSVPLMRFREPPPLRSLPVAVSLFIPPSLSPFLSPSERFSPFLL